MTIDAAICVRPFIRDEVAGMIELMRGLAALEDYLEDFAVTEADLVEHGLGSAPSFGALVATVAEQGPIAGIAVHYVIPWTYDLRPTLVLKELYVDEGARGNGVGRALMRGLAREARRIGAPRIAWSVLPDNAVAQSFYRLLGGRPDTKFEPWHMNAAAIDALAD